MKKSFHISDVLSVTTGRLLSTRHMAGVYEILNHMTQDDLCTHQLPRAQNECRPYLLEQFPVLASPEMQFAEGELTLMLETVGGEKEPDKLILGWLSKLTSGRYGITIEATVEVEQLPDGAHLPIDPAEELKSMVGKGKVTVIHL